MFPWIEGCCIPWVFLLGVHFLCCVVLGLPVCSLAAAAPAVPLGFTFSALSLSAASWRELLFIYSLFLSETFPGFASSVVRVPLSAPSVVPSSAQVDFHTLCRSELITHRGNLPLQIGLTCSNWSPLSNLALEQCLLMYPKARVYFHTWLLEGPPSPVLLDSVFFSPLQYVQHAPRGPPNAEIQEI